MMVNSFPKDGNLQHPTNSQAWNSFDERNISFASLHNMRLGLATEGFLTSISMNVNDSIWLLIGEL